MLLNLKKVLVVFLALFFVIPCGLVDAQSNGEEIVLESPKDGVVYFKQVPVAVRVTIGTSSMVEVFSRTYSYFVDGQPYSVSPDIGYLTLNNLSQGEHSVQVKCSIDWGYLIIGGPYHSEFDSGVITFYVNLGIGGPEVKILCAENYVTNQVPLTIMTNTSRATVSYSLDDKPKLVLPMQDGFVFPITLSNLTDGSHTLTVYAKDFMGNTGTAEKNFTINGVNPTSTGTSADTSSGSNQSGSSPITNLAIIVGAAMVVVILASGIITVMHFRHKPAKAETSTQNPPAPAPTNKEEQDKQEKT
jgi:hypothetical protein